MHSSNESETLNKYFYISAVEILQMLNAISCTQYLLKIIISYCAVISPGVFFLSMRPLDYCFIRVDANRSLFVFDVLMLFSWRVRRINLKCAPKRRCCSRTPAGDTGSPHPGRSSARTRSESLRWKFGVSTADERLWNTAVTRARERERWTDFSPDAMIYERIKCFACRHYIVTVLTWVLLLPAIFDRCAAAH